MQKKKLFRSGFVIAGLVCMSFILSGCAKKAKKKVEEREVRVTVQKIEKRNFRRQIPVQGTVDPVQFAVLSAKLGGTVEHFPVSTGMKLKKGDTIYGIDRQVLKNQVTMRKDEIKVKQAEVQNAEASKASALLSRKKAELDYKRAKKLHDSKAISDAEFEEYDTNYQKAQTDVVSADAAIANARAQLKQAESNLTIAEKNLADSTHLAPFDCTVVDTYVEEKEYVSTGSKILKIENLDSLEVVCYISAVYYNDIVQDKTKVEISMEGRKYADAVITFKAPSIDPQSRTFKIKALVPKNCGLVSGMLCSVNIILEEKVAYGLPADAFLLRANDRFIVYAVGENNRAKSFDVKPGIVDGIYREVLNPEKLMNEQLIVSGQSFVNVNALLRVSPAKK